MITFKVVIPARYESVRLPGKPLADIAGRALILRTADRARESGAKQVVIATDDSRIADLCRENDLDVVMTRSDHQSGTDRIAEVAQKLAWGDDEVVINVQGDEPCLPFENIAQVATLLESRRADIATLATPIINTQELHDPNIVKVVSNIHGLALYFSRAPIPFVRDADIRVTNRPMRHIGIYAFRVASLLRFSQSPASELEHIEKLEQLRALWSGWPIRVAEAVKVPGPGVDTVEDLERVRLYFNALGKTQSAAKE